MASLLSLINIVAISIVGCRAYFSKLLTYILLYSLLLFDNKVKKSEQIALKHK